MDRLYFYTLGVALTPAGRDNEGDFDFIILPPTSDMEGRAELKLHLPPEIKGWNIDLTEPGRERYAIM